MAMRIPAGQMRHKVTIQQHKIDAGSTAYDTYGQVSTSSTAWETVATVRAKIEQVGAIEGDVERAYPKATHRATIDYNPTVATTGGARKRLLFQGRPMFIGAVVNPDFEDIQLQLWCGEER